MISTRNMGQACLQQTRPSEAEFHSFALAILNPHAGDKPRLYELQNFQFVKNGHEESIKIIEVIASRWRELGTALKFESHLLRNIEMNCSRVEDRCYELLRQWLNDCNEESLTWETLLHAMPSGCAATAKLVLESFTDGE